MRLWHPSLAHLQTRPSEQNWKLTSHPLFRVSRDLSTSHDNYLDGSELDKYIVHIDY
jgi:hypothetical protein